MAGYADIIFFAAIAVYLVLKLSNLLGRKESDEEIQKIKQNFSIPAVDANSKRSSLPNILKPVDQAKTTVIAPEVLDVSLDKFKFANDEVKKFIEELQKKEIGFNFVNFVSGAKSAFEMLLKAYSENDRETLKMLLSPDLYKNFETSLDNLISSGVRDDKSLVSINLSEVKSASLNGNYLKIALGFNTEQISVTKDLSGNIVGGSTTDIEVVDDTWEFERNIKSTNPNWTVVAI